MRTRLFPLAILSLAGLGLGGCTATPPAGATATQPDAACSPYEHSARGLDGVIDFIPASGLAELEAMSTVVVRGTVAELEDGPRFGGAPTRIVRLAEPEVLAGSLPEGSGDSVYLRVFAGADDRGVRALPPGAQLVLYADDAGSAATGLTLGSRFEGETPAVEAAEAGAPADQTQYVAAHPQGLVVEHPGLTDNNLVWPLLSVSATGTLADAQPGGTLSGYSELKPCDTEG